MIAQLFDHLRGLVDLGGPVVMILICMSIVALTIVLWKIVVFQTEGIGSGTRRGFVHAALRDIRPGSHAPAELRERLYARLDAGFGRVGCGLRMLDVTAQIAPLLGLFGTVLGMIDAFRTLQEAGSSADPSLLAGGIWVALMTTAAGLVVAMPASLLLNWFEGRLEAHRRMAVDAVEELLTPNAFEQRGRAVPNAQPA
ncbi:MotA/TolQ/ExbB proton channel family protein [Epibacterium sp. SM1969]|uniref:MotA/TolQ/ExbB proton channel family protein n=1 Tax=Tritonibacter aquimaris TaxID=2663379 RepID=A0A844AXA9_9RHOB|nr:MotA/TolQ/ExbB proton channel family protein [Tritonibacter aquimaris]MQY44208.1 MotA/TolQ/ExbB proton channel family protein [Tritonibacter aquimaris]